MFSTFRSGAKTRDHVTVVTEYKEGYRLKKAVAAPFLV